MNTRDESDPGFLFKAGLVVMLALVILAAVMI